MAVITRSNFTLFGEAVKRCVYSDSDIKVAFAGVCFLCLCLFVVQSVSVCSLFTLYCVLSSNVVIIVCDNFCHVTAAWLKLQE